jgi:hypothetical protein
VSARYWVLIADELMDSDPQWPDGLRIAEPGPLQRPWSPDPHARWWLLEDDGAPASLEGKLVELIFTRSGDKVQIGSRNPAI